MKPDRSTFIHSDELNTYNCERDGKIDIPVQEALELSQQIHKKKDDTYIQKILFRATPHTSMVDSDDQGTFENDPRRMKFLAVHMAANIRGLIAPAFRPQVLDPVKPSSIQDDKNKPTLINTIYSIDQQLIDLHWFYCRELELDPDTVGEVEELNVWQGHEFFAEDAEAAVQLEWSADVKTKALHIPPQVQVLLNKLRTKQIRDLHWDIKRSADGAKTAIAGYCRNSRQHKVTDKGSLYKDLYALKLAKQDIAQAANIRFLMEGKPLAGTALDSMKRKMRRRLKTFKEELRLLR